VLLGVCGVSADCSGLGYDLSALQNTVLQGADTAPTPFQYSFLPCGVLTDAVCQSKKGSVCQYSGTAYTSMVGTWTGSPIGGQGNGPIPAGSWSALPSDMGAEGVQLKMNGLWSSSTGCGGGAFRTTVVSFVCAKDAPVVPTKPFVVVNPSESCSYSFTITTSAACKSSHKGALSGGTIFLIILIVVIPVYVAVGCVYKRKRQGQTGMEACPNIEFWRDLPGLIKDGFSFTFRKLRGLCGASSESYETVK